MKKCYECNKSISSNEVVKGMIKYWDYVKRVEGETFEFGELGDWVNCKGNNENFVRETDEDIVNEFYEKYFVTKDDINPVGMVTVCEDCVTKKYDEIVKEIEECYDSLER